MIVRKWAKATAAVETMATYRVAFVGDNGHVFDVVQFEHDTDETAIEEARRLDVPSLGAGFEVWHADRLIHRHRR
jgi:hypothetical protein